MLARRLLALRDSVAALIARARRRPPSLPASPAPGVYRARPELPALPPELSPPPAPPQPKPSRLPRTPFFHALTSSLFTAAGLIPVLFPRRAEDRLWGVLAIILFGTGAWVFWEQVAVGLGPTPLAPPARRRTMCVAGLGGLVALAMSVGFESASPLPRLFAAVLGLLFILPGLAASWSALRAMSASRASETAPRRRSTPERRPHTLMAPRSWHTPPPPPTPDLRAQRRRWRRRG